MTVTHQQLSKALPTSDAWSSALRQEVQDAEGKPHAFGDLVGKEAKVLVIFVRHWCESALSCFISHGFKRSNILWITDSTEGLLVQGAPSVKPISVTSRDPILPHRLPTRTLQESSSLAVETTSPSRITSKVPLLLFPSTPILPYRSTISSASNRR